MLNHNKKVIYKQYAAVNSAPLNSIYTYSYSGKATQHEKAKLWRASRNRAYRKLRGKVPPGWKLRIAAKRFSRFFMAGKDPGVSNIGLWENKHFVTATRYLGEHKQPGYPYVKCFMHPGEGPTWSLSNWGIPGTFHKSAQAMISISEKELEQVFKCMDALRDFMSEDPLSQIRANAKSDALENWKCI